jgi:hypothetical protein
MGSTRDGAAETLSFTIFSKKCAIFLKLRPDPTAGGGGGKDAASARDA